MCNFFGQLYEDTLQPAFVTKKNVLKNELPF